jgi:hypothetical protein
MAIRFGTRRSVPHAAGPHKDGDPTISAFVVRQQATPMSIGRALDRRQRGSARSRHTTAFSAALFDLAGACA